MATVGELEVTQPNMASAALDHVAGADRKFFGQANCLGTHDDPPAGTFPVGSDNGRVVYQFRDNEERIADSCESLWITLAASNGEAIVGSQSFKRSFRPGPKVLDHLRGRQRTQSGAGAVIGTV
jgi:hypothetical protein